MPYFYYIAIDRFSGDRQKGVLTAEHINHAFDLLHSLGLVPEKIREIPAIFGYFLKAKPHLKTGEMIEFLKGVGHALNAGVSLLEILVALQNEMTSKGAKVAIQELAFKVAQGNLFSQAMRELNIFPPLVIAFAEVGEATGNLGENLIKAAQRLEFVENIKSQTKRAMIYPVFILLVMIGAILVWLFLVIPRMTEFLATLNIKLPVYTRALFYVSQHKILVLYFFGGLAGFVFLNFLGSLAIKRFFGKDSRVLYIKDWLLLKIPVVGGIINNYNLFIISSFMSALISAGIAISQVFIILFQSINNAYFYAHLLRIDEKIREGETLSEAFKKEKIFPPMFIRYLMIGERTGTLDNQLDFLGFYYRDKLESVLTLIPKILEPVIIIFMGLVMFGMIVAVFMPIYSSISTMLKGLGS